MEKRTLKVPYYIVNDSDEEKSLKKECKRGVYFISKDGGKTCDLFTYNENGNFFIVKDIGKDANIFSMYPENMEQTICPQRSSVSFLDLMAKEISKRILEDAEYEIKRSLDKLR